MSSVNAACSKTRSIQSLQNLSHFPSVANDRERILQQPPAAVGAQHFQAPMVLSRKSSSEKNDRTPLLEVEAMFEPAGIDNQAETMAESTGTSSVHGSISLRAPGDELVEAPVKPVAEIEVSERSGAGDTDSDASYMEDFLHQSPSKASAKLPDDRSLYGNSSLHSLMHKTVTISKQHLLHITTFEHPPTVAFAARTSCRDFGHKLPCDARYAKSTAATTVGCK